MYAVGKEHFMIYGFLHSEWPHLAYQRFNAADIFQPYVFVWFPALMFAIIISRKIKLETFLVSIPGEFKV